ncbi:putative AAA family ATPase/60S ribosome export protein Rix7 [Aspergillus clavatus NRRL 1]|uniref:AAA family ATPase/60S ribosome export protein Rix7, putative n=1 Tax=Aspergillus clavatus (strain ATCC 1007 / CBS 513.65 / DSM 816 / NCTC 3887 / NRRL 1 / QM 1276 / 107) TaxID=344612 RepID=A1CQI8_ASPCL|nr:AAA family ATPase/60S ribosome export protein Rix7, putative [Aspergillus clavatus NRRL 1]EAW07909.1 AAA family ATPase/60S ribosome export protein Rix7, putative [Aspergillus clavatus NRRL 1]
MRQSRGGRPSLRQGLDREVYQIVRKIIDDQPEGEKVRLSVSTIYDTIKRSNSSLNRKPKRILEDSIERVVEVVKTDVLGEDEEDSVNGDFEGLEEQAQPVPDSNSLNRSLVGMWNTTTASKTQKAPESNSVENATPAPTSSKRRLGGDSGSSKRRKADSAVDRSPPTHVSLADLGGLDDVVQELGDLLILPMTRPQVYMSSNVQPPRGVLLHGPPGCGKTMIANAFAAELGIPFIPISAPSIVSGMSGESEKALREHFEEAKRIAPCLIFIDEIDAITPKRESAQREMEKRIVAQLLTCMDDLALDKTDGKPVIVLAATNRPDSLDAALRRGGRFDKEINMTVPSEPVREQILRALTRKMRLADDLDFKTLAKRTPGFVGADLNDLVSTAGSAAIKRYLELLKSNSGEEMDIETPDDDGLSPKVKELRRLIVHAKEMPAGDETQVVLVSNADFFTALPKIQPSSKREGFATIPDTTWADIGALGGIRDELSTAIVEPIKNPDLYASVGITAPTGVLLWGPPGCGKTLLAKAVANESRANFISVKGPELLNKFVGESERAVRQVFVRARSSVPCVIFFDELDALVPRRDDTLSEASARVVNTLLTELDGLGSSRQGIFVIAATNRPDIIDPAMLRPGRLETLLFVNLPSPLERADILQTLVRKLPIEFNEDLRRLAEECEGFSGADLGSLLRRAGYSAIKRRDAIKFEDFVAAKAFIRPSVTDLKKYEKLRRDWSGGVI